MANIAVIDYEAQSASTIAEKIISCTGILYNDQFQELVGLNYFVGMYRLYSRPIQLMG